MNFGYLYLNRHDLEMFFPILLVVFHFFVSILWCTELSNFDEVQILCVFFYWLWFWCPIWEIVIKSSVMKIFPSVFFQEFYSCSSFIYVFDLFWVKFCVWCESVRVALHSLALYQVFWAPLVEKTPNFFLKATFHADC